MWQKILGKLFSMALALLGTRCLFSQMQEVLCHMRGKLVMLARGIHEALVDFRWLVKDLDNVPCVCRNYTQYALCGRYQ